MLAKLSVYGVISGTTLKRPGLAGTCTTIGCGASCSHAIEYSVSAFGATTTPSLVFASSVKCENWLTGASPRWSGTVTLVMSW